MSYAYRDAQPNITADAALQFLAGNATDATARWILEQLAQACAALATDNDVLRHELSGWEAFAEARITTHDKSAGAAGAQFDRMVASLTASSARIDELERTMRALLQEIADLTPTPEAVEQLPEATS